MPKSRQFVGYALRSTVTEGSMVILPRLAWYSRTKVAPGSVRSTPPSCKRSPNQI